jgi:hypothetical protein
MKIHAVFVSCNYNLAAVDDRGAQIPALQTNLLNLWAETAAGAHNAELAGQVIETPYGQFQLFQTPLEGKWNCELRPPRPTIELCPRCGRGSAGSPYCARCAQEIAAAAADYISGLLQEHGGTVTNYSKVTPAAFALARAVLPRLD